MHLINGALGPDQTETVPLQEISTAVSSLSRAADPIEMVEGDRSLARLRTKGQTVPAEDIVGRMDD